MAAIKKCSCQHKYQDETYGKGMRVKNEMKRTASGQLQFRCTVCRKES